MSGEPQSVRNAEIYRRYAAGGITLKALGLDYGLTKERVRQIVACRGVTKPPAHESLRDCRNALEEIRDILGIKPHVAYAEFPRLVRDLKTANAANYQRWVGVEHSATESLSR